MSQTGPASTHQTRAAAVAQVSFPGMIARKQFFEIRLADLSYKNFYVGARGSSPWRFLGIAGHVFTVGSASHPQGRGSVPFNDLVTKSQVAAGWARMVRRLGVVSSEIAIALVELLAVPSIS